MIPCSDDVRQVTDKSLAPVHRNRRGLPQNMNVQVKPIDGWSRGVRRRLLVEPTFESFQPTLPLEMELTITGKMILSHRKPKEDHSFGKIVELYEEVFGSPSCDPDESVLSFRLYCDSHHKSRYAYFTK
ncbi:unnamed protein product [Protopolystoma xenopodis]|uniref:Uncharacterized protein n=1 Tax=Protopolystoma xenopodis TaxID=117903 RepID=A0A448XPT4_9PLAT|nr:unnamed protein product [Protopolystoma xenopodis]